VIICTDTRTDLTPAQLAWMVKCSIEGFALGYLPAFKTWGLPPLYQSGVRFQLPQGHGGGVELMKSPLATYRDRWGDCDRLMIWWLCEQWAAGRPARCSTMWLGNRMHVLGRRSWNDQGPQEDPSVILGAKAA